MKTPLGKNVVILGASDKPERYSNKALHFLSEEGYVPIPVNPTLSEIDGVATYHTLDDVKKNVSNIDTITVYVNPTISSRLFDSIIKINPRRVIFNPGSENKDVQKRLSVEKIEVVEACTLVLLRTGQF